MLLYMQHIDDMEACGEAIEMQNKVIFILLLKFVQFKCQTIVMLVIFHKK